MDRSEGTTEYDRPLELSSDGFARASSKGDLPHFDAAHLATVREIVRESLELWHLELLQEKAKRTSTPDLDPTKSFISTVEI